jgi:hypothetical protein
MVAATSGICRSKGKLSSDMDIPESPKGWGMAEKRRF